MKPARRTLGRLLPGALLVALLVAPGVAFAEEETSSPEAIPTTTKATVTDIEQSDEEVSATDISSDEETTEEEGVGQSDGTDAPPNPVHMWNSYEESESQSVSSMARTRATAPYFKVTNGIQEFYDGDGKLFASPAMFVIDVSEHNGNIDWDAFHAAYPDAGVIIRLGYGEGNVNTDSQVDLKLERNLAAVKRLGIPYGVYLYSYSYSAPISALEAHFTADIIEKYDIDPELGIFYDLEAWKWAGHQHPTTPQQYEPIVRAYFDTLMSRGYDESDIHVYSYTSYLQNELNSPYIHERTTWVAQYWSRLTYDITAAGQYGWQYSSTGRVTGLSGNVDMNAFSQPAGTPLTQLGTKVTNLSEGDYVLLSGLSQLNGSPNSVVEISGGSLENLGGVSIHEFSNIDSQVFHIKPNGDGSYSITARHSGKALDVPNSATANGTNLIQWDVNNDTNQRWTLYRDTVGYYYIASVCAGELNRVMTVAAGSAANDTPIQLWGADGSNEQRFRLVPRSEYAPGRNGMYQENGVTYWYMNGFRVAGRNVYDPAVDGWRFFEADGTLSVNKDFYMPPADGDKWVRLDERGIMVKGEDYRYGGWYYFDEITGAMAKGVNFINVDGGKWVYYDVITGQMAHGEAYLSYDAEHTGWYLFDQWTGKMYHGDTFLRSSGGKWVRYDHITGKMIKGLQRWDGSWYYFDPITGAMAHGYTYVPDWGRTHYFDNITGRG